MEQYYQELLDILLFHCDNSNSLNSLNSCMNSQVVMGFFLVFVFVLLFTNAILYCKCIFIPQFLFLSSFPYYYSINPSLFLYHSFVASPLRRYAPAHDLPFNHIISR